MTPSNCPCRPNWTRRCCASTMNGSSIGMASATMAARLMLTGLTAGELRAGTPTDGIFGIDRDQWKFGPPDSTEIAVAEPIRRTAHRNAPPGMLGSCADPWRMAFASGPENRTLSTTTRRARIWDWIRTLPSPAQRGEPEPMSAFQSSQDYTTATLGHEFRETQDRSRSQAAAATYIEQHAIPGIANAGGH